MKRRLDHPSSSDTTNHHHHYRHRRRPIRMVIPKNEEEWRLDRNHSGVYEWDWERLLEDTTLYRIPRPLSSSTVLASLVTASSTTASTATTHGHRTQGSLLLRAMPLLQPYLQSQQQEAFNTLKNGEGDSLNYDETTSTPNDNDGSLVMDAVDDCNFSMLTKGQHDRYQQLVATAATTTGTSTLTGTQKQELSRLAKRVQQERGVYQEKIKEFFLKHAQQFKTGLNHSTIGRYCEAYARFYQTQWQQHDALPLYYNRKCQQVLSMKPQQQQHHTMSCNVTLDSISSRIIHIVNNNDNHHHHHVPVAPENWQSTLREKHITVDKDKIPSIEFLQNDTVALQLAQEHGASIVTTRETLEHLLQLPGGANSYWKIPFTTVPPNDESTTTTTTTHDGRIILLDLPLPQPTIPRTCVSRGVQEGLYQELSTLDNSTTSTTHTATTTTKTVYTLVTVPWRNVKSSYGTNQQRRHLRKKNTRKVLVKSIVRVIMMDPTNESEITTTFLSLHVQLEYFYSMRNNNNKANEAISSYQRSLWILDQILLSQENNDDHYQKSVLVRVCPSTMRVLSYHQVSIAHALLATSSSSPSSSSVSSMTNPVNATTTTSSSTTTAATRIVNDDDVDDPLIHWQGLIQILHGLETIQSGQHLLCLTAGTTSISVHTVVVAAQQQHQHQHQQHGDDDDDHDDTDDNNVISIVTELEQANVVYTGAAALQQCAQEWEWNDSERIPFTFPIFRKDDDTARTSL